MRYFQLQSHVGYGLVGNRAVFIDLRRDRYLVLDARAEEAFRNLTASDEPMLPAGAACDALLATGLFRQSSLRGRMGPTVVQRHSASLLDEDATSRPGLATSLRAWSVLRRTRKRLAATPLHDLVDEIREARKAVPPQGDCSAAERAARVFFAARALAPVERSCLLDCLAMLDWLGGDAGHALLVFGVRLDPFGAHCWLQTERKLLTDAHDTVSAFVPVLSV